jgi:tetratricopeptide (TPR) repeat protein
MAIVMKNKTEVTRFSYPKNASTKTLSGNNLDIIIKTRLEEANILSSQNELEKAYGIYKDILGVNPQHTLALIGICVLLEKQKKYKLAIQFISKAIETDPSNIQALLTRGRIFRLACMPENAILDFTKIIENDPENFKAFIARGITLGQIDHFIHAIVDFSLAADINPNCAEAFYNRGVAYEKLHRFGSAIEDYSASIKLNPSDYKSYNNRGVARREIGCFDAALRDFEKSIRIKPDFSEGYYNKSLSLLSAGKIKEGFKLYEYRWKTAHFQSQVRHFPKPLWLGSEDLTGKIILLHSEQGLGDSIQFCRYIKFFENMQCQVLLEIEKPLMAIMQCLLPQDHIIEKNSPLPDFDVHCPLMSLPYAFKTSLETIPCQNAYLNVPLSHKEHWATYLGEKIKPRVGVVWRGNPKHPRDCHRSFPLRDLMSELTEDIDWLSLQFEISQLDEDLISNSGNIRHFGVELGNFDKSGGLIENLDAVLSVDTSMAHLAAALGKPVYLLLGNIPDSRWLRDIPSSPWYPTIQIYKRSKQQTWRNLIATTISKLRNDIKFRPNSPQKIRINSDAEKI